jgi:hypothetical protein
MISDVKKILREQKKTFANFTGAPPEAIRTPK